MIYMIRFSAFPEHFKLGYTSKLCRRLTELCAIYGEVLEVQTLVLSATEHDERHAHDILHKYRTKKRFDDKTGEHFSHRGEFFDLPGHLSYIATSYDRIEFFFYDLSRLAYSCDRMTEDCPIRGRWVGPRSLEKDPGSGWERI